MLIDVCGGELYFALVIAGVPCWASDSRFLKEAETLSTELGGGRRSTLPRAHTVSSTHDGQQSISHLHEQQKITTYSINMGPKIIAQGCHWDGQDPGHNLIFVHFESLECTCERQPKPEPERVQ
ncbi:uncharacterized protein LY89DRAFT_77632 [Mollisia scopiformis]|uniref:Uncharacterized protein n=1 Tax=Mollisia scopiformis TaxID=149040 RepID=A0A194X7S7_MOLSC|nr:uncharacterized protein LY89DRAFT_77632 [Mollisia scopiformis]KUJ16220.1 hypothetical protein LY89DRAFT_77632 [Mollisia scopiformis]